MIPPKDFTRNRAECLVQGTGPSYSTANSGAQTLVPAQLERYTGWQTTLNLTGS